MRRARHRNANNENNVLWHSYKIYRDFDYRQQLPWSRRRGGVEKRGGAENMRQMRRMLFQM